MKITEKKPMSLYYKGKLSALREIGEYVENELEKALKRKSVDTDTHNRATNTGFARAYLIALTKINSKIEKIEKIKKTPYHPLIMRLLAYFPFTLMLIVVGIGEGLNGVWWKIKKLFN